MRAILLLTLLYPFMSTAQEHPLELTQSSPAVEWETISNDFVQLIYPKYLRKKSVYVANLIEHSSQVVGQTYGIQKPRTFPLVLRPEMAAPNGFVTLAPRRSEWFRNSTYNSYGTELEFESNVLRILPLNIGVRIVEKLKSQQTLAEVYSDLSVGF